MTKTLKQITKAWILILGISILFNACDKDSTEILEHNHDIELTEFSTIDFSTFKINIQNKDISNLDIDELISPQTEPISELQYSTQSESQNFVISIDSTDVLMAEKNGITSYTFKTQTTDMSKTTNYVLAHDDNNVKELYITYEDDGSVKIIEPTSGFEVTTQSASSDIWCPYAEVVEVCGVCGSSSCESDGYVSQFEIVIHYEPCPPSWGSGGTGNDGGSNNSGNNNGEGNGGTNGDGSTGGNDLPIDGPIVTKPRLNVNQVLYDCLGPNQSAYYNLILLNTISNMSNENQFDIASFIDFNGCSSSTVNFLEEFIEIKEEIPAARFKRYKELTDLIEDDPWILIQDCAEQNGLETSNYIELYQHTIPQECQNRLDNLGIGYFNQPISEGNVPLANIDYYAVEISQYPDFNNDGLSDSEGEIYQSFRENFPQLASGELDDFEFSCDIPGNSTNSADIEWEFEPFTPNDSSLFVSNNPIAAIFLIEASASGFLPSLAADDGTIIVSDFTNNNWTISTITSLENGSQPFSGNRQWGWLINENGNLELFTRAVDVAKMSIILNSAPTSNVGCQQDTYYNIAEATWENMQQEIVNWVNNNGGQANLIPKTAVRVDEEKILELLTSNETINQIDCD